MKNKLSTTLPSRFFFAPINTGFIEEDHSPSNQLIDFHDARSGKMIGISYVGNVAISRKFVSNTNTSIIKPETPIWKRLTETIKRNGSIPGIQLACKLDSFTSSRSWKPAKKSDVITCLSNSINNMPRSNIQNIFDRFLYSAKLASDYGFDVIQIHAAHGYFLSLLMSDHFNKRTDEFSSENIGGIKKLISNIKKYNSDIHLDLRLSCIEGIQSPDLEWQNKKNQIVQLTESGISILSLSAGIYDITRHLIYPHPIKSENAYLTHALEVSKNNNILVNVAGALSFPKEIDSLPPNLTFGFGRALLADPNFIEKKINNMEDSINNCINSGACHYFTTSKDKLSCKVNSQI